MTKETTGDNSTQFKKALLTLPDEHTISKRPGHHISTYILNFRNKEHYLKTLQIKIQDVILEAPDTSVSIQKMS